MLTKIIEPIVISAMLATWNHELGKQRGWLSPKAIVFYHKDQVEREEHPSENWENATADTTAATHGV
jgi:hypothetical protein